MKQFVFLLALVLLLTSCASPPKQQIMGDVIVAEPNIAETESSEPTNTTSSIVSPEDFNIQSIRQSDGSSIYKSFSIDDTYSLKIQAVVNTKSVERVSTYKYIPTPISDSERTALFETYFQERANEVKHHTVGNSDCWVLRNEKEQYHFNYGRATGSVYEDLFVLRNCNIVIGMDMINSIQQAGISLSDSYDKCSTLIPSLVQGASYQPDCVRPHNLKDDYDSYCLWITYRRVIDGIPITSNNDLRFFVTNNEVFFILGSLYDIDEIPLTEQIISLDAAIASLEKNASLINTSALFIDEICSSTIPVSEITFEYIVERGVDFDYTIVPIWRFQIGSTEEERLIYRDRIIAVNALTGDIISERRGIQL